MKVRSYPGHAVLEQSLNGYSAIHRSMEFLCDTTWRHHSPAWASIQADRLGTIGRMSSYHRQSTSTSSGTDSADSADGPTRASSRSADSRQRVDAKTLPRSGRMNGYESRGPTPPSPTTPSPPPPLGQTLYECFRAPSTRLNHFATTPRPRARNSSPRVRQLETPVQPPTPPCVSPEPQRRSSSSSCGYSWSSSSLSCASTSSPCSSSEDLAPRPAPYPGRPQRQLTPEDLDLLCDLQKQLQERLHQLPSHQLQSELDEQVCESRRESFSRCESHSRDFTIPRPKLKGQLQADLVRRRRTGYALCGVRPKNSDAGLNHVCDVDGMRKHPSCPGEFNIASLVTADGKILPRVPVRVGHYISPQ